MGVAGLVVVSDVDGRGCGGRTTTKEEFAVTTVEGAVGLMIMLFDADVFVFVPGVTVEELGVVTPAEGFTETVGFMALSLSMSSGSRHWVLNHWKGWLQMQASLPSPYFALGTMLQFREQSPPVQ